jgi:hypothetical protein
VDQGLPIQDQGPIRIARDDVIPGGEPLREVGGAGLAVLQSLRVIGLLPLRLLALGLDLGLGALEDVAGKLASGDCCRLGGRDQPRIELGGDEQEPALDGSLGILALLLILGGRLARVLRGVLAGAGREGLAPGERHLAEAEDVDDPVIAGDL